MGNLFNSLSVVADSMRTMQRAIEATSNNVVNAQTPGYVKQTLPLIAKRFELESGQAGGLESTSLLTSRKRFLELGVHEQNSKMGRLSQEGTYLERLEPVFDISADTGIHGAMNRFFDSVSALSVNPNDTPARQTVIDRASDLAQSFRFAHKALNGINADSAAETDSIVSKINRLGAAIQQYNVEVRSDVRNQKDAGLESGVYQAMEDLSEQIDFDILQAGDGTFTINLGGQTPLTIGGNFFPISADFASGSVKVYSATGGEITNQIQQGRLRSMIDLQNNSIQGLNADLNRLAASVASEVNAVLAGGLDRTGQPPAIDLFRYDATVGAAATLDITAITPDDLAAASVGAAGGNGNALATSALAKRRVIDDFTFSQFYGSVAGGLGRSLATTRQEEKTQTLLLAQAKSLRSEQTSVNLDEEAANLIAFQRQYQANAEMIRVLNELTEAQINLLR